MKRVARAVKIAALLAVIAVMASCGAAFAAEWPKDHNTVRVIWHSAAGSGGDRFFRALSKILSEKTDVPFIVENITGASGANAWTRASQAKPDGSTILGVSSTFITSTVQNNMPITYDSFDPVGMMVLETNCIYTNADSPFKTLEDFFVEARKRPGEFSIAGGTAGNSEFVAAKALLAEAGVDAAIVPFEGGGEGVVAVMGGHLDLGIGDYGVVAGPAEEGRIRVLALYAKQPGLENIPIVADYGYKTKLEKFRGVLVPKGTPQEIKDRIFALLKEASEDPEYAEYCKMNFLSPRFHTGAEFYEIMKTQAQEIKDSLTATK